MLRPSRRKLSVTQKPSEFQNNSGWEKRYQSVIKTSGRNRKTIGIPALFGSYFLFPLINCLYISLSFYPLVYSLFYIILGTIRKDRREDFLDVIKLCDEREAAFLLDVTEALIKSRKS